MATKESIYKTHNPGGDDLFLKLKDGDNPKLRVYSEPVVVLFKAEQKPRYAWTVWNHDLKKAQVYGAGISVFGQIAALVEDWGEPTTFDIRITRKGSGQFDTEYIVSPVKDSTAMTKEQEEEADKIDLIGATKGKWLADYAEDGILPDPVTDGLKDEVHPVTETTDEEDLLKSIPF